MSMVLLCWFMDCCMAWAMRSPRLFPFGCVVGVNTWIEPLGSRGDVCLASSGVLAAQSDCHLPCAVSVSASLGAVWPLP